MEDSLPSDWKIHLVANPSRALLDSIVESYRLEGWRTTRERLQIVLQYGSSHLLYFGSEDFVASASIISVFGNRLWVGFSLTRQDYRRRGLYPRLIRHLFSDVVGDPPAVPVFIVCEADRLGKNAQLGFEPVCKLFKVQVSIGQQAVEASEIEKPTRSEILELDRSLLGGDRSDKLSAISTESCVPPQGVYRQEGKNKRLAGYAMISRLHGNLHLGPMLATDEESARRLLRQVVSESARMVAAGTLLEAWVPEPNLEMWLSSGLGCSVASELHILCRGGAVAVTPPNKQPSPLSFFEPQFALYGGGTG